MLPIMINYLPFLIWQLPLPHRHVLVSDSDVAWVHDPSRELEVALRLQPSTASLATLACTTPGGAAA